MQIVIKLSEEDYDRLKEYEKAPFYSLTSRVYEAVANGTPLPKGHGKLKDENEIKRMIEKAKVNSEHSKTFAENIIRFASTIIEADTEREGEK